MDLGSPVERMVQAKERYLWDFVCSTIWLNHLVGTGMVTDEAAEVSRGYMLWDLDFFLEGSL